MTNPHIQAAVEAGAKALNVLAVAQGALDDWDQWAAEAEATLDAMLPHLREMIAEEIRTDIAARTWYEPIQLGMKRAANIAEEGPQQ